MSRHSHRRRTPCPDSGACTSCCAFATSVASPGKQRPQAGWRPRLRWPLPKISHRAGGATSSWQRRGRICRTDRSSCGYLTFIDARRPRSQVRRKSASRHAGRGAPDRRKRSMSIRSTLTGPQRDFFPPRRQTPHASGRPAQARHFAARRSSSARLCAVAAAPPGGCSDASVKNGRRDCQCIHHG